MNDETECCLCGETIENGSYCEDCRDSGDLEDIFEELLC